MARFHRLLGAIALALLLPAVGAADDAQEVQKYVLTDAGLAKYQQAARKIAMLPQEESGVCDDAGDAQSISQVVAKMNRYPAAKGAIVEAGMTPREYVVFSMALLQTGLAVWGADQSGGKATGVSDANVAFFKKNDVFLKKLDTIASRHACDWEEEEGEDTE